MTLPKCHIMVFAISLLGLVVPIFDARPVLVMIVSRSTPLSYLPLSDVYSTLEIEKTL